MVERGKDEAEVPRSRVERVGNFVFDTLPTIVACVILVVAAIAWIVVKVHNA